MIKIDFYEDTSKDKIDIVSEFYDKINTSRRAYKWKKLDAWCKKYLPRTEDGGACTFEMVVKALPEKLIEYKHYLDANFSLDVINDELRDGHTTCYTETLYASMNRNQDHENVKYLLLKELGVTVCPYCNRNYIYSDEEVTSCELDHFFPKSKYPIFAVSFYNLIPVCSYCNKKKNDVQFTFFPHKMKKTTDELLRFEYDILGADYLKYKEYLKLRIETTDPDYAEEIDVLKLEKIYSFHTDILQDILRKKEAFSDTYLNNIYNQFQTVFSSPDEVKELIYGTPLNSENYGKRPLAKMTADIVREIEGGENLFN